MSNTNAPAYDQAFNLLRQQVYEPVFFNTLEQLGFQAKSADDAAQLLGLGDRLAEWAARQEHKQAGDRSSWLAQINARLDEQLGLGQPATADVKAAAAELLGHQQYRDAALLIHDATRGEV